MPKSLPKFRVNINLLHPQGTIEQLPVKFLRWVLEYGRFIVVFVEIVVLATFVTRFKLDADLANLKEEINRQIPFIDSLYITESLIKQTQFRIASYKSAKEKDPNFPEVLRKVSSQTPPGVKFSSFSLNRPQPTDPLQLRISGEAVSNNDVSLLLFGLRSDPTFQNIILSNVSLEKGVIKFALIGNIK